MKSSQFTSVSAALIATCALVSTHSLAAPKDSNSASAIPAVPVGVLSASPTIVQTGTKPTLNWSIQYPNNGHGNNLDGVDSSNPGQGHGGPNGEVDPSAGVDDEIR